ncbi:putative strictosidine synthase [Helianthus annuus]|nr:putative strictosidine synthase [Helianthus annuus]
MRCSRYYIHGEKEGSTDVFIDRLPGMPDNIHYDGEGHYWIGIAAVRAYTRMGSCTQISIYSKAFGIFGKVLEKTFGREKCRGGVVVDLNGNPIARYYDPDLKSVTSVIKIREHLYLGNLVKSFIIRLNLTQYPATAPSST